MTSLIAIIIINLNVLLTIRRVPDYCFNLVRFKYRNFFHMILITLIKYNPELVLQCLKSSKRKALNIR